jgi:hypothetical protein
MAGITSCDFISYFMEGKIKTIFLSVSTMLINLNFQLSVLVRALWLHKYYIAYHFLCTILNFHSASYNSCLFWVNINADIFAYIA